MQEIDSRQFSLLPAARGKGKYIALVGTADGNLHAIDSDMQKIWTSSSGQAMISSQRSRSSTTSSSSSRSEKGSSKVIPTLNGGILYNGPGGMRKTSVTARVLTENSPFITNEGILFTAGKHSKLVGIDVEDGTLFHDIGIETEHVSSQKLGRKILNTKLSNVRKSRPPLWLGRIDYNVRAVDGITGEEEFSLSYSEIRPLEEEKSRVIPIDRGALIRESEATFSASSSPEWKSLVSTPEGDLFFLDNTERLIRQPAVKLKSPVVHAFIINLEEEKPRLQSRLPVHYSLNDMQWRHKMRKPEDGAKKHAEELSLYSLTTAPPSPPGSLPVLKSMVIVESNEGEGGGSAFAMEAYHDPFQDFEVNMIIKDENFLSDSRDPSDVNDTYLTRLVSQLPQLPPTPSLQTPLLEHSNPLLHGKRIAMVPKLPISTSKSISLLSSEKKPLVHFGEGGKEREEDREELVPRIESLSNQQDALKGVRGYYRLVKTEEEVDDLWVPRLQLRNELLGVRPSSLHTSALHRRSPGPFGTKFLTFSPKGVIRLTVLILLVLAAIVLVFTVIVVLHSVQHRPDLLSERSLLVLVLSSYLAFFGTNVANMKDNKTRAVEEQVEQDEQGRKVVRVGSLFIYEAVLGYGSHGTVVFLGSLNGRPVAVKRMLAQFVKAADREISLLIRSDGHPNVVRYFLKEERNDFVYLGLQLCEMSLRDFITKFKQGHENSAKDKEETVKDEVRSSLLQIAEGLAHLHSLRIVHRDIKPHNILLAYATEQPLSEECRLHIGNDNLNPDAIDSSAGFSSIENLSSYVLKISDMGLSKQLDKDELSFSATSMNFAGRESHTATASASGSSGAATNSVDGIFGTVGWQAPELIVARREPLLNIRSEQLAEGRSEQESFDEEEGADEILPLTQRRTLTVDVFSLGCVMFYVITGGEHPFGEWYEREANIISNKSSLGRISSLPDAIDIIECMLNPDPSRRPSSQQVCAHPFFWCSARRLDFLVEFSDRLEKEAQDSNLVLAVEVNAHSIIGTRWDKKLDSSLLEDVGKYRKYDVSSVRDLLRIIRNKRHHFHDLSPALQQKVGPVPVGFVNYFELRFPRLLLHCCRVARRFLHAEKMFHSWMHTQEPLHVSDTTIISSFTIVSVKYEAEPIIPYDVPTPLNSETMLQEGSPISSDLKIWSGSALHYSMMANAWWRDSDSWIRSSLLLARSASKKGRASHLIKAASDLKYRTRLCTHWESTGGGQCPMRKKGKCIFAHGPQELRVKENRRDKWGKSSLPVANSPVSGGLASSSLGDPNRFSGGEDVLGAAKSIEKIRIMEGSVSDFERSSVIIPSNGYPPLRGIYPTGYTTFPYTYPAASSEPPVFTFPPASALALHSSTPHGEQSSI